jgi:hypothetical protein
MLMQGIVQLVQENPVVLSICPLGGFYAILPEGQPLPSWTWIVVSDPGNYMLEGKSDLGMTRIQLDCFGDPNGRGADAIALAKAIDTILSGFSGVLEDPEQTIVDSCFLSDLADFPEDPASRSFRRMLEYEVWAIQPVQP